MKHLSFSTAAALMVVSGVVGLAIGYYLTPQYSLSMYDKNTMELGKADTWVDLRYINAMAAHHRGAMLLAGQAKEQSTRQEIKELASAILDGEPRAIASLYALKREWYGDIREARDPVVARLGSSGDTFDLRFLNALIAHHEAGIQMARDIRQLSSRSEILDDANAVEAFLTDGVTMLKEWRKQWYNI